MSENIWPSIWYQQMVRNGLPCPLCGERMTPTVPLQGQPVRWCCESCGSWLQAGPGLAEKMRASDRSHCERSEQ